MLGLEGVYKYILQETLCSQRLYLFSIMFLYLKMEARSLNTEVEKLRDALSSEAGVKLSCPESICQDQKCSLTQIGKFSISVTYEGFRDIMLIIQLFISRELRKSSLNECSLPARHFSKHFMLQLVNMEYSYFLSLGDLGEKQTDLPKMAGSVNGKAELLTPVMQLRDHGLNISTVSLLRSQGKLKVCHILLT